MFEDYICIAYGYQGFPQSEPSKAVAYLPPTVYLLFFNHIKDILIKIMKCCAALLPFRENPMLQVNSIITVRKITIQKCNKFTI